jgi:hypothetical protein
MKDAPQCEHFIHDTWSTGFTFFEGRSGEALSDNEIRIFSAKFVLLYPPYLDAYLEPSLANVLSSTRREAIVA